MGGIFWVAGVAIMNGRVDIPIYLKHNLGGMSRKGPTTESD
jgi:hypothetical protein